MVKTPEAGPSRVERATFVREVQRYLLGASASLHAKGIDIGQMQYDGKTLFIGTDKDSPPKWSLAVRQDTVRQLLESKYPHLEIGFHPVAMSPEPFSLP